MFRNGVGDRCCSREECAEKPSHRPVRRLLETPANQPSAHSARAPGCQLRTWRALCGQRSACAGQSCPFCQTSNGALCSVIDHVARVKCDPRSRPTSSMLMRDLAPGTLGWEIRRISLLLWKEGEHQRHLRTYLANNQISLSASHGHLGRRPSSDTAGQHRDTAITPREVRRSYSSLSCHVGPMAKIFAHSGNILTTRLAWPPFGIARAG